MSSLNIPQSLKQGVGRKILGLFLLAGLLPVIFTALLAYYEIGRMTQVDVEEDLRKSAKAYGVDILLRIEASASQAAEIARIMHTQGLDALADHELLLDGFTDVWRTEEYRARTIIKGPSTDQLDVGNIDVDFLADGKSQLLISGLVNGPDLYLVRAADPQQHDGRYLVFRLDAGEIWGPRENIPYNTDFCVRISAGHNLYCTNMGAVPPAIPSNISTGTDLLMEWDSGEHSYLGSAWQLFLTSTYRAPSLDIIASQPRVYALQSKADFRRVFVPALLLVIVLVGVLSFWAIGQSLVPLQYLTAAARQFAAGNLSVRVRLRSDDELGSLADAFNNMASRLGEQIEMLKAMSGIDRLILRGGSFEQVSENVVRQLLTVTDCEVAAVISRDDSSSRHARMITGAGDNFTHDSIALPNDLGNDWCQPRQVSLEVIDERVAPYKEKFLSHGQKFVLLIPVILNDEMKGILLIGSKTKMNMSERVTQRCIDLAGRFAVALSSVEREEALYRQAHYDELTGLPNRQLLKNQLEDLVDLARLGQHTGALLYLDLDRFKEINDVYGHSVGDVVLTQTAERIISEVRDDDIVSRLGGDEFVIVLPRVVDNERVKALANRLLTRLTEVFAVFGVNHFVSASIGVVMFPDDGGSVETLLKNADAAMYRAKDAGRARYEFFNVALNDESRRKIELERDLRAAFTENDLEVYYQPQFDLSSNVISGAEALLRWKHPRLGFVSPAEFIPLAEESQLIVDIGRWVVEQACRDLRTILDKGLHPGPVSINVSARQLAEKRLVSDVLESLQKHKIHPGFLQLEVTETTVAQNRDTAITILTTLRENGVRVALDDFGTGYSSLSYLQNMPFDVIKIDKSFVDLINSSDSSDNICRTIIRMARELGKASIAEGVETRAQVDFLSKNGCDRVQGFFYAEALPLLEFIAFIRKQDFHTQRRKALELI